MSSRRVGLAAGGDPGTRGLVQACELSQLCAGDACLDLTLEPDVKADAIAALSAQTQRLPTSRRADSNRRPLHYEGLKDENGRASDDTPGHEMPANQPDGQLSLWSD